ncbi:Uncharacterised protein [Mycobacteroides abscessus]|nr:Uncharacterised protein [Mycobacteroides abscessus]
MSAHSASSSCHVGRSRRSSVTGSVTAASVRASGRASGWASVPVPVPAPGSAADGAGSQTASGAPDSTTWVSSSSVPGGGSSASAASTAWPSDVPCRSATAVSPVYCSRGASSPDAPWRNATGAPVSRSTRSRIAPT